MATEEGGGGMEDVETSLEPESEETGILGSIRESLGSAKESYVDFHTVDEDDGWGGQQVAGGLSRRGFLAGTAEVAAAGYVVAEATDGDGLAVDLSNGNGDLTGPGATDPGAGPGGAGNETQEDAPDTYGENQLGVQADVSDELYLQEDGTVVAVDHGHKEWRAFSPDNFPENEQYADLHEELSGQREATDMAPPSLGEGIEVSQQELFGHDTTAYNDMSDEAEWDLIFDENPSYSGGT